MTPPAAAESRPRIASFDVNCPSYNLRMDILLFPTGSHLLAAFAARPEIVLAVGDRRLTFADDLRLEIRHHGLNLALLQEDSRIRGFLIADVLGSHASAFLALGPGELVEMWHCGAAGDAAADGFDQLVVVELGRAQVGGFTRRL